MISFLKKLNLLLAISMCGCMARRVDRDHQALTLEFLDQNDQTCKQIADDSFAKHCDGDWHYAGNGQCCTIRKFVHCAHVLGSHLCPKPWVYLGNDQCCLTSDAEIRITEKVSYPFFCTGAWIYMGLNSCVTTKRAVKCVQGDKNHCKAPWHWLGFRQCCLTSDSELQLTEAKGSRSHCNGNWTYVGQGNCVITKRAECVRGDEAYCKAPWSYIGFEHCCLTSEVEFQLTDVKSSSEYCKGDWTYLGHGTCVSTKQAAKCIHGYKDDCKAPWSYLGNGQCCLTAENSWAKMQSSISVVPVTIFSFCLLWQ